MATIYDRRKHLKQIRTISELVDYLRDELDWPLGDGNLDDLVYDYEPEELGIDPANAAKIRKIQRLRSMEISQPWGIFFIEFEPKRLPVVALRRILSGLVTKRRASANPADRGVWAKNDLIFISNYGTADKRQITLAHFSSPDGKLDLPTLNVVGWDDDDTLLHLDHSAAELDKLRWPADQRKVDLWRDQWRSAFTTTNRYVATTSKDLAIKLAELARKIRNRLTNAMQYETPKGPLKKLMAAFQQALIHDLTEDTFADMYAQTIAYGLLSARIANPTNRTQEGLLEQIPITNPFLKELLSTFLDAGGRKTKRQGPALDFDELGVSEVVQLLDDAKMDLVLRDFGNKNPQEDPVIHFYELFLKEYDAKKRMQRGVFYTPRPVVSYIVRSVHELLQTEFGLDDGLADTATWGDMAAKVKELKLPEGVTAADRFVTILDPATGTGTFLVEIIDVIFATLEKKWKTTGHNDLKRKELWNAYVPAHLLPRLHAYELQMAPYAIAHMKVGLKLFETGYEFKSDERARVYLTNALEPATDSARQVEIQSFLPALAHEAAAVNAVKKGVRFTVVVGNPPYSIDSSNTGAWIRRLLEDYYRVDGRLLDERNPKALQDDYVKFLRVAQQLVADAKTGVCGFITNHGWIDNPTFRGQRQSLTNVFDLLFVLDLHGNSRKKEKSPDGSEDENVFAILQGVAIMLGVSKPGKVQGNRSWHADLWRSQQVKYQFLIDNSVTVTQFNQVNAAAPFYVLSPEVADTREEFYKMHDFTDIFGVISNGFKTHRDHVAIAFDRASLESRIKDLSDLATDDAQIRQIYEIDDSPTWALAKARRALARLPNWRANLLTADYRPLDRRQIFYSSVLVDRTREDTLLHMKLPNIGVMVGRQGQAVGGDIWNLAWCGKFIADTNFFYRGGIGYAPLWLEADAVTLPTMAKDRRSNIKASFARKIWKSLASGNRQVVNEDEQPDVTAIFHFVYAILHAVTYRTRYAEFLKIDFPRIPLTSSLSLFQSLAQLGADLIALHLVEAPIQLALNATFDADARKWRLNASSAIAHGGGGAGAGPLPLTFAGPAAPPVKTIGYSGSTVWLDYDKKTARGSYGFSGIPENVWNFHIGGYQVCEKWLKDRRTRTLTADDVTHYCRIVVALHETIRLMGEIDVVIEEHGGWPGAFQAGVGA